MSGIPLSSSFDPRAAIPLDNRTVVDDVTARDAILSGIRFEGLIVYVRSVATNYQLVGGITNSDWTELSGSGGGGGGTGSSAKKSLLNNDVTPIPEIGEYITDASCIIIVYFLYRRTDDSFKSVSGTLFIEGNPDAALSSDRWKLFESSRSENGGSFPSDLFTLDEVDTDKSILNITLDDLSGANHQSTFFYTQTVLDSGSFKAALNNNSANTISSIGRYISDFVCLKVDYYLYRRTDSGFKSMSGTLFLEANPDASLNPDKWKLWEAQRSERGGDSGVSFSLDDVDTGKSVLVATLDDMYGANHSCIFYYSLTELSA
jgi:hypothetical protein